MARILLEEISAGQPPESLVQRLNGEAGLVLLRSALLDSSQARFSFVTARPFLSLRSVGSRCELSSAAGVSVQYGDPWRVLEGLMARYEVTEQLDLPLPLGGCFGYWGYELKNFIEPKLSRRALNDLEIPDCHLGFYGSVVAFDHRLGKTWIIATGLDADGSRSAQRARAEIEFWKANLAGSECEALLKFQRQERAPSAESCNEPADIVSNLSRSNFVALVQRAQDYIRAGDIYQVNLSQRLSSLYTGESWSLYDALTAVSPAPFSAYLDCGDYQLVSSSPELFLRLSGRHALTRPIKGTRPRCPDPTRDAQLAYELQTSSKELAELVMITDLLRNDLGRVCEFGSVQVPDLARLERFSHVQHLVSSVEGRLRTDVTHSAALAACFPGGSITGAPKFRAMQIIEELEPIARGPYTGALGYLGFNQESQLSIIIRAALCRGDRAYFNVGAGIVADSVPESEYEETMAKGRGFLEALHLRKKTGNPVV